jgi:hypothetical protein
MDSMIAEHMVESTIMVVTIKAACGVWHSKSHRDLLD